MIKLKIANRLEEYGGVRFNNKLYSSYMFFDDIREKMEMR